MKKEANKGRMGLYILDHGSSSKLESGHMNVVAAMRLGVAVLWAPGCSHPAFGPTSFGPKSEGLLSARFNPVYIFPSTKLPGCLQIFESPVQLSV